MNLREIKKIIDGYIGGLSLQNKFIGGDPALYEYSNIQKTKDALNGIEDIDIFKPSIQSLKDSPLYQTHTDKFRVDSNSHYTIDRYYDEVKFGCIYLKKVLDNYLQPDPKNAISIKLPKLIDFDDMSKILQDLNKVITIPVIDKSINGKVKIENVESGSIWFIVGLGSPIAVGLVGSICWSSAVINKKRQEAKMFEQHVKTLELKNEEQKILIDAQKRQLDLLIEAEANNIQNEYYKENSDNEQLERLKLSIETLGKLIINGAEIHPALNTPEDVKNLFPDFKKLDLIESKVKSIGIGN